MNLLLENYSKVKKNIRQAQSNLEKSIISWHKDISKIIDKYNLLWKINKECSKLIKSMLNYNDN